MPDIPQINLDELSNNNILSNFPNSGSFTDLCVVGTQIHLFETPRYSRTVNIGSILMHPHGMDQTIEQPQLNKEISYKAIGYSQDNKITE